MLELSCVESCGASPYNGLEATCNAVDVSLDVDRSQRPIHVFKAEVPEDRWLFGRWDLLTGP